MSSHSVSQSDLASSRLFLSVSPQIPGQTPTPMYVPAALSANSRRDEMIFLKKLVGIAKVRDKLSIERPNRVDLQRKWRVEMNYQYDIGAGRAGNLCSFLSIEDIRSLGSLPNVAVYGSVVDDNFAAFRPNPEFMKFMHRVIREAGPLDASKQAAAADQRDGWVYVIDLRTPDGPQGNVPIEDIIGGFEVKGGLISSDAYRPNDGHLVHSEQGFVQLPPSLHQAMVDAVWAQKGDHQQEL